MVHNLEDCENLLDEDFEQSVIHHDDNGGDGGGGEWSFFDLVKRNERFIFSIFVF